ncbi:HAD-IA family hydrolase [Thalassobaculum sp.]|uniref:HAD family hydrolase n=1 Tax=Thalassobaculum sp. TaxID=2022740 RepID=UPI0032F089C7
MPEIQALMVDVDGVLVTGRPQDGAHWQAGLAADLAVDTDALNAGFFRPHWQAIVTGQADLRSRLAEALKRIAPHVSADRLIDYWFRHDARLDVKLLSALAEVRRRGVPVHLATNQEHERMRYLLGTLGLAARVDDWHCSADLGCRKPDPAFFAAVQRRVGIEPAGLLLLDDTAENVHAATATGWHAVRWTGAKPLEETLKGYLSAHR